MSGMENLENRLTDLERKLDEVKEIVARHARGDVEYREIPDDHAEKDMKDFVRQVGKEKDYKVSVYDFVINLNIPPEQVERILEKAVKEGKVREVDE